MNCKLTFSTLLPLALFLTPVPTILSGTPWYIINCLNGNDSNDGKSSIASPIIDGPKPFWPGSVSVSGEGDARQSVLRAKSDGADFIKVYSFLPRDAYFAIADQA